MRSFIHILTKAANDQEHNARVKDGITTTKLEIKVLSISMRVPQTSVTEAHDERKVALVDPDGGNSAESVIPSAFSPRINKSSASSGKVSVFAYCWLCS